MKPGFTAGSPASPALPPEQRLVMPRAGLHRPHKPLGRHTGWHLPRSTGQFLARVFVAVATAALTVFGVQEMMAVISRGDVTALQYVFLGFFAINFAWISFALAQAMLGFVRHLSLAFKRRRPVDEPVGLKTAILVPVYNEAPVRVTAAVSAMAEGLAKVQPGRFCFFILSDTTSPEAWLEEEAAVARLVDAAPEGCPVYYRHRAENRERKAGNIGEWVERFGGGYDAMLVLDADSVMTPETIVELTHRLESNPDLGLIQTLPRIVRARSLYARLQQFANRCYGPIYGNGLAAWHGRSSNFWGHNAIIRTRAFAEAARLPELEGKPPFGGHILSHDFAEAAFLRRAGWGVRLDTDLEGSYEEAPPSLIDVIIRDRRWCQGNLQHSRLLTAEGFSFASRLHFFTGIFAYLSAVFWFALVVAGMLLAIQAETIRPEYFAEPSLFPLWPVFDAERAIELFIISMAVVLGPKLLGWLAAMLNPRELIGFGGPITLTASLLWEVLFSALYAPIMMLAQTRIVTSVLMGRDSGWNPQRRDDGGVPFEEIGRAHLWHMVSGLAMAAIAWWINPSLFLWILPLTAGLVLAIPLSAISGHPLAGRITRALRLGRTPEERKPAPVLTDLSARLAGEPVAEASHANPLARLVHEPALAAWHLAQVPSAKPGELPSDDALAAIAKSEREDDPAGLAAWLTKKQMMALMARPEFATWLARTRARQAVTAAE